MQVYVLVIGTEYSFEYIHGVYSDLTTAEKEQVKLENGVLEEGQYVNIYDKELIGST